MTDASDDPPAERATDPTDGDASAEADAPTEAAAPDPAERDRPSPEAGEQSPAEERDRPDPEDVEEKYDFEEFGPQEMAEMSYEEWEVAFDHGSWITGERLLDRVEADLKSRVADRDVFAVVERVDSGAVERSPAGDGNRRDDGDRPGDGPRRDEDGPALVAYSDEGYAVVYPDGTVQGSGTVLRDVKPSVALASMESYEVPEMPEGDALPDPAEVPEGSGKLGNQVMQVVAAVHVLAGVALVLSGPVFGVSGRGLVIAVVVGLGFLVFGGFAFLLVANARLSDRFRAEEYRNRLRAVGVGEDERPAFLPGEGGDAVGSTPDDEMEADVSSASDGSN